jgi:hypothetical protein
MPTSHHSTRALVLTVGLALAFALGIDGTAQTAILAQAPQGAPANLDLVGALKATPGVLGVEAARTQSGKQVLFAWFANKKAALDWFYSDAHQSMMRTFMSGVSTGRQPLADVPDDGRPILAIASLTYTDAPSASTSRLPVSQIAIELYAPLPGGLSAGGRFAPAGVNVPGMLEGPITAIQPGRQ